MKSAQALVRLYPRLKPDERARLTLAAMARGDDAEVQRLRQSCPRKRYEQPDEMYLQQVEASRHVAARFALLWQEAQHDLTLAELVLEKHLHPGAAHTDRKIPASEAKSPVALALSHPDGPAAAMIIARAARLRATYAAMSRFAKTVGIDVAALLAWYDGLAEVVQTVAADMPPGVPSTSEDEEFVFNELCADWPALEVQVPCPRATTRK